MNPLVLILGGVGLWILLKKKSEDSTSQPSNVVNLPEVVIKPSTTPVEQHRTGLIHPSNSTGLSTAETELLNGATPDELYNNALSSKNRAFVTQAANQLAEAGDTRAMDLTLRLANWNS